MSEPAPSANPSALVLVLLLLAVAALVYLDWRKGGEIENLHARIDQLSPPLPFAPSAPSPAAAAPSTQPATPAQPTHPAPPAAPVFVGDGEVLPGSAPVDENAVVEPSHSPHPLVQSVLRAHSDGELDEIGRDQ